MCERPLLLLELQRQHQGVRPQVFDALTDVDTHLLRQGAHALHRPIHSVIQGSLDGTHGARGACGGGGDGGELHVHLLLHLLADRLQAHRLEAVAHGRPNRSQLPTHRAADLDEPLLDPLTDGADALDQRLLRCDQPLLHTHAHVAHARGHRARGALERIDQAAPTPSRLRLTRPTGIAGRLVGARVAGSARSLRGRPRALRRGARSTGPRGVPPSGRLSRLSWSRRRRRRSGIAARGSARGREAAANDTEPPPDGTARVAHTLRHHPQPLLHLVEHRVRLVVDRLHRARRGTLEQLRPLTRGVRGALDATRHVVSHAVRRGFDAARRVRHVASRARHVACHVARHVARRVRDQLPRPRGRGGDAVAHAQSERLGRRDGAAALGRRAGECGVIRRRVALRKRLEVLVLSRRCAHDLGEQPGGDYRQLPLALRQKRGAGRRRSDGPVATAVDRGG